MEPLTLSDIFQIAHSPERNASTFVDFMNVKDEGNLRRQQVLMGEWVKSVMQMSEDEKK